MSNAGSRRAFLRRSLSAALILATVMCLAGIFQHGLWTPDEPREAEIGREMLVSGWSSQPTLSDEPFLEKPPLFPWVMAAGYRVFGVSPGVSRLPAALFSIGSILVAFALGRRAGGRWSGLLSAAVLATCAGFATVSHSAVNDTALIFFVSAGHLAFLAARDAHAQARPSRSLLVAGACAGLAFLTKGFIGPVLLCGPPILASIVAREWAFVRFALPRAALWSASFVAALGLPWVFSLASTAGWSAVRVCLVDNTLGRSVSGIAPEFGHAHGPLYYLQTIPVEILPWTLVIPALVTGTTLGPWRGWRAGRARWLAVLFLAGLVLLSVPATKRELYALPLFPAASAVIGVWLSRVGTRRGARLDRATLTTLGAVVGIVLLAAAGLIVYSSAGLALPLKAREAATLIQARTGSLRMIVVAAAAFVAGVLALVSAFRFRHASIAFVAATTTASVLVAVFTAHAAVAPLIDPVKDMSSGAREVGLAVPAEEPLLGVFLDETTRAVLPYYSGRIVSNAVDSSQASALLTTGSAHHLIVMEQQDSKLDPGLRARLRPVARVSLTPARVLIVYRHE